MSEPEAKTPAITRAPSPWGLDDTLGRFAAEKGLRHERSDDYWGDGKLRDPWRWWQRRPAWRFNVVPLTRRAGDIVLGSARIVVYLRADLTIAEELAARIVAELGVSVEVLH